MAQPAPLEVKVVTRVRGLWKLALLNFLMRHVSKQHVVHVHLNANGRQECVKVVNAPSPAGQVETPPSLRGS